MQACIAHLQLSATSVHSAKQLDCQAFYIKAPYKPFPKHIQSLSLGLYSIHHILLMNHSLSSSLILSMGKSLLHKLTAVDMRGW